MSRNVQNEWLKTLRSNFVDANDERIKSKYSPSSVEDSIVWSTIWLFVGYYLCALVSLGGAINPVRQWMYDYAIGIVNGYEFYIFWLSVFLGLVVLWRLEKVFKRLWDNFADEWNVNAYFDKGQFIKALLVTLVSVAFTCVGADANFRYFSPEAKLVSLEGELANTIKSIEANNAAYKDLTGGDYHVREHGVEKLDYRVRPAATELMSTITKLESRKLGIEDEVKVQNKKLREKHEEGIDGGAKISATGSGLFNIGSIVFIMLISYNDKVRCEMLGLEPITSREKRKRARSGKKKVESRPY